MTKQILRKLLGLLITLFVIMTVSFFLIRLAPGGPFSRERVLPEPILRNLEAKYNLDEPLLVQYAKYMLGVCRLDLGLSTSHLDHTVSELIAFGLPHSMFIGFSSMLLAALFGILTGIASAYKRNTWVDYVFMSIAVLGISIPLFVIAPLLQLLFALNLHWLPTAGWFTMRGRGADTIILPIVSLMFGEFAYIARLTRASVLEVLQSDYIRTAQAKGLSRNAILGRHVLKGALLPVVTFLGPALADIMTGSVVIEQIFQVPGVGRYFVQAALNRDYFLIMGTVLVYAILLLFMNFVVDILYGFLDPRIATSKE